MVKSDTVMQKMDRRLYEETRAIALKREMAKLDKRASPPRVQRKILNHPLWAHIREDLCVAKFLEDN